MNYLPATLCAHTFARQTKTLMKALKILVISIGLLAAVYLILALFGSSTCHVERSTMINADPMKVHAEVDNLKHWKSWSYWDNIDTAMKSSYEGPDAGVGAIHRWESENENVGKGSLTITESEPGKKVITELAFEGMGTSIGGWTMQDTAGMTKVTAYMDMDISFFARPIMMFMDMDGMLGADFEKSLEGLKKHVESLPTEALVEYQMEMSNVPGYKIMSIKDSASLMELSAKLGPLYGEIQGEMQKQGLSQAGPVVAIYDKVEYRPEGMYFWYSAGIPVDKPGKSTARVNYWESDPAVAAVKCNYYGGYNGMGGAHEAIDKYMKDNNKVQNGAVWEVYVTDPMVEADSTKWLTEIYYPAQ